MITLPMPLQKRTLVLLLSFILLFTAASPLSAFTIYDRTEAARSGNVHTPKRFGYVNGGPYLPQAAQEKKCIPHGQARCLRQNNEFNNLPKSRYSNRIAEQNDVHPLLRHHYKFKTTQNF